MTGVLVLGCGVAGWLGDRPLADVLVVRLCCGAVLVQWRRVWRCGSLLLAAVLCGGSGAESVFREEAGCAVLAAWGAVVQWRWGALSRCGLWCTGAVLLRGCAGANALCGGQSGLSRVLCRDM